MKTLIVLASACVMASPLVGFAQGSAGKPVTAQKEAAPVNSAQQKPMQENPVQQKPVDPKMAVTVLTPAPDFEVKDAKGQMHKLSDYKGKWVVLEWTNAECPFVKKHYSSGNMQKLQKTYTDRGVIWLTVHSTSKGHDEYLDPKAVLANVRESGAAATANLMDTDGKIGKAYGARNTPHMFVINPAQQLFYVGAIDDTPSPNAKDIPTSKNYIATVLNENLDSKTIAKTGYSTKPYGCSVKY